MATNRTFYFPSAVSSRRDVPREAKIRLRGSGVPEFEVDLTLERSFLSIRLEADQFVGGVHFEGVTPSGERVVMEGPFEVAVPDLP